MKRLRFATVGSVDDGKSTLIGRLLYDSKSIFEDQLEHIEAVSKRRGDDYVDLSLLTDGLRAEREQGITIDVAYRYFATPKRSFIIADCPGHIQYTRNMITGASNVDLAIVLVDARTGVVEQTRRHSLLVSLLGVPHLVICVNKMDLVGYDQARFDEIRAEFEEFASRLELQDVTFLPISALAGDNVVARSTNMDWFEGPTLLHHLENVYTASDSNRIDVRFPVQYVIRPQRAEYPDYRGYAGRVAGGVLRVGDDVMVLPSGLTTTITGIDTPLGPRESAEPGEAVTLLLADDLSITRGDMICRPNNRPRASQELEAMLCWMDDAAPLQPGKIYSIKHTTRLARAKVNQVLYRLNISNLHRESDVTGLAMNEIGRVTLHTTTPLFFDDYHQNRVTGCFILVDETTGQTAGAGMLLSPRT
ncbi:MAG: sulfate adenylyltransferase subunit 1 [Ilumatobacteraceae bacterium]|jgi:bifunctional enzyme CysN/CysC